MKIQLKHSSVLLNGAAKAPSVEQMEYGEIALNFNSADPAIFFKDNGNAINKFSLGGAPDLSNSNSQSGTYDDRYLRLSGGTISGDIYADQFIGGVARISNTPPVPATAGELWYNTDDGRTYVFYQDADSSQWVDAAPDTFELTDNYYSKAEGDARYLRTTGGTATGTLNLNGTGGGIVLTLQDQGAVSTAFSANGSIAGGSVLGQVTDSGYNLFSDGSISTHCPSTTADADLRFAVIRGTTISAAINSNGDLIATSFIGDGNAITNLSETEVKTAYEANADTNAFTDAEKTKLSGIEAGATADQTGTEIKALYEAEADVNRFTNADHAKLDGIEAGAQVNTVTSVNGQTGDVTVTAGGGGSVDIQEFTTSGTWFKPADAKVIVVEVVGGGGGGGSGANNSNQSQAGGSGGAGAMRVVRTLFASDVSTSEIVTVGAGGAGGTGLTLIGQNRNGKDGTAGEESSFGIHAIAGGGNKGRGGRDFSINGAEGTYIFQEIANETDVVQFLSATGGTSYAGVTGSSPGRYGYTSPGGGGGGGNTRSDGYVYPPGEGGLGLINERGASSINVQGGGTPIDSAGGSYSGGGGGSGKSDNSNGNAGGNGGFPGGGGGGGGAAFQPGINGDGGAGGNGRVRVITYF